MIGKFCTLVTALLILLTTSITFGAVPQDISYQGYLIDNAGVPVNTTVSVTFSIYDAASSGNLLWSDTRDVTPVNGVFAVSLDTALAFDQQYWLGVKVGADNEMSERIALNSSGRAIRAVFAEDVTDGSIVGDMISDGAITRQKLADSCVPGEVLRQTVSGWVCGPSPH